MEEKQFVFITKDSVEIQAYKWLPQNNTPVRGIIQLAHGMAEHALRYRHFARFLNGNGFVVYAHDHRGHGQTSKSNLDIGFFDYKDGWFKVVGDMHQLTMQIKTEYPDLPVFIFGHSMGSLLTRTYIALHPNEVTACVLSGTSGNPGIIRILAKLIIFVYKTFKGKRARVKLLDTMSFGAFNSKVKNPVTKFDWLSTDASEVQKYIEDPWCGSLFSIQFFDDLIIGLSWINKKKNIKKVPANFPLLFISGSEDPVGEFEKGVLSAAKTYKNAGIKRVDVKLYKGKRHELVNEVNKQEVFSDVLEWLNENI